MLTDDQCITILAALKCLQETAPNTSKKYDVEGCITAVNKELRRL